MKRKKLYGMLALGMAMSLIVGVPVSAAGSINTGVELPTDNGDGTETKPVNTVDIAGGTQTTYEIVDKTTGEVLGTIEKKEYDDGRKVSTVKNPAIAQDELEKAALDTKAPKEEVKTGVVVPDDATLGSQLAEYTKDADAYFEELNIAGIKTDSNKPVDVAPIKGNVLAVAGALVEGLTNSISTAFLPALESEEQEYKFGLKTALDINVDLTAGESVTVRIPIPENKLGATYFVLHQTENGWERLQSSYDGEGIVFAVFDSFSPILIVEADAGQKDPGQKPDNKDDGNVDSDSANEGDDNGKDDSSSPASSATKATPASTATTPTNPAVSPKTGEL